MRSSDRARRARRCQPRRAAGEAAPLAGTPEGDGGMYEHRSELLLTRAQFFRRMFKHALAVGGVLAVSLGLGVLGYHGFEGLPWLDALLNASMILGGMGPVDPLKSTGGKLFASFYALFSGIIFL